MAYFVCFILSVLIFFWVIMKDDSFGINQIMMIAVAMIGNGGYYALTTSTCLEKAILANDLTYLIGIFIPMFLFFNVCEICQFKLPHWLVSIIYAIQILLYLSVCTTGRSGIFYKTVEFHMDEKGVYLTKTYGPMHTVYLIALFAFLVAMIGVLLYSSKKRNVVSFKNVDLIVFVIIAVVGTYVLQRLLHLTVELFPFVFTMGVVVMLFPITKIRNYSVDGNKEIIDEKLEKSGFIVFTKELSYMGCNQTAAELFPELEKWELEKKVPGSGGRFNTFLRQPLMQYIHANLKEPVKGKPFAIKEKTFGFWIRCLNCQKRHIGYIIEIIDMTDLLDSPTDINRKMIQQQEIK